MSTLSSLATRSTRAAQASPTRPIAKPPVLSRSEQEHNIAKLALKSGAPAGDRREGVAGKFRKQLV